MRGMSTPRDEKILAAIAILRESRGGPEMSDAEIRDKARRMIDRRDDGGESLVTARDRMVDTAISEFIGARESARRTERHRLTQELADRLRDPGSNAVTNAVEVARATRQLQADRPDLFADQSAADREAAYDELRRTRPYLVAHLVRGATHAIPSSVGGTSASASTSAGTVRNADPARLDVARQIVARASGAPDFLAELRAASGYPLPASLAGEGRSVPQRDAFAVSVLSTLLSDADVDAWNKRGTTTAVETNKILAQFRPLIPGARR